MSTRIGSPGTYRRALSAATLAGLTLRDVAARCAISQSHLRGVLLGERHPSERLYAALEAAFGAAWPFVRGQVDALKVSTGGES